MLCQEIAQVNEQLRAAVEKRDTAAATALYTADAIFYAENTNLECHDEIEALYGRMADAGVPGLVIDAREVLAIGENSFETGDYTIRDESGTAVDVGRFVVIWQRVDGEWCLHRDVITGNLPT